ncbi:MAG: menaquinone biosynthesis protein [Nitrospirota bacterium]
MPDASEPLLRIGKIPYANLFPIFYMLEKECDCSQYEFVEGVPSRLNRLLRDGAIDISPSSSIEYLRYQDRYSLIDDHSISSKGPVGSILLFSRKPIERMKGLTIFTLSQSETSVVLLDIILKKFYGIESILRPTDKPIDLLTGDAQAYLSIGDDALKTKKSLNSESKISNPIYIYDLGELWYRNTGLPFVFALWIVRKSCYSEKAKLLEKFISDLDKAKILAMKNLDQCAKEIIPLFFSQHSLFLTEDELIAFWKGISYDFGAEHQMGLNLFRRYSEELGLL